MEPIQKEMLELSALLLRYQNSYYVQGVSMVSDLEYDRLNDRLLTLEAQNPQFKNTNSPTSRVGSDLTSDLAEYPHSIPVLSLDKAYSVGELLDWCRKTQKNSPQPLIFTLEEKMDGVSIVLYYEQGNLVRALTRGNGEVGNDVTANVRTIGSVPLILPQKVTVAVRGEIFLPKNQFALLNEQLGGLYANPRNLTAGVLRRIKSREVAAVPLNVYFYEGFFEQPPENHRSVIQQLKDLGFPMNPRFYSFGAEVGVDHPLEALEDVVQSMYKGRSDLPYEIDGLVMKVDSNPLRELLGYTGHHPRWAIAYKFESPQGISVIEEITVQVGRTGRITPVARIKPTLIGGSTITYVTLHNQAYIEGLELSLGDTVAVSKRGDVIPAVESVLEKSGSPLWHFPNLCPSCGGALEMVGAHHFCLNRYCPDQVRGNLKFFVAKDQMDIENLGPETLEVLLDLELVKDPADLYSLDFSRLEGVPGFGPKKIELIKQGIEVSRERPWRRVLASLGIPELGHKVAELLEDAGLLSWQKLREAVADPTGQTLTSIHGIGEKTAQALARELSRPEVLNRVERLGERGLNLESSGKVAAEGTALEGTVWCVTGSFERYNPRSLAEAEIKKLSGKVVSAVSGAVTHLLAGDKAGSKLAKAQVLGVKIVNEAEFQALLDRSSS